MRWTRSPRATTIGPVDAAALRDGGPAGARRREVSGGVACVLDVVLTGATLTARLRSAAPQIEAERAVDLDAAGDLAATIGSILNRATRWGDADQGSRELLRQHGELLFDSLLPLPVKLALRALARQSPPPALTLVLDGVLLGLPWELMHTGEVFLGLGFALGRITRGIQAELPVVHDDGRALRALIVCDPRGDLIGSYYEGLTLRDELAESARLEIDLRSSEVSLGEVRRLLREYDVVHFAGHAEPAGASGERGWWLRDGVLGPAAIRELTGGRRFPRLIFSNACRSAGEGQALESGAAGLAAAFLAAGVEHYIGTVHDVPDEPASLFALTFYETLLARPKAGIGEAVRAARATLAERYGADSVYWASWVLYGAPASACLERAVSLVTPEPAAASAALELPALGARVRGSASTATLTPLPASGWQQLARVATLAFSAFGFAAAVVMIALALNRAPPVPWSEARAMPHLDLPARAVLEKAPHSVRFAVPFDGYVALWRLRDGGRIERVDAAGGPLRRLTAGALVVAPVSAAEGAERFYLAWRQVPPSNPAAFEAELGEAMRGLQPSEARRVRFKEALEDRFDTVTELLVGR